MIFFSPIAEVRVRKWTGGQSVANPPAPKSNELEPEEFESEELASLEKSSFNEAFMVPFYWGALDGRKIVFVFLKLYNSLFRSG